MKIGDMVLVKDSCKPYKGIFRPLAGLTGKIHEQSNCAPNHYYVQFEDDPPNLFRGINRRHLKVVKSNAGLTQLVEADR